jgi:microcystin-dependent protein
MALEVATYTSDLVATNPTATDPKSQGDDHVRLTKTVLRNTWPNITGPVTATQAQLNTAGMAGMLFDYAGGTVPTGFLACDGAAVSRTTYSALFSAIGAIWGAGDGSTTFNVPDLRRRATIGSGGSAISGPTNAVGSVGGGETNAAVPNHTHTYSGITAGQSNDHTHIDSGHSHGTAGTYPVLNAGSAVFITTGGANSQIASGTSTSTANLGGTTSNHTHNYSGTTDSTGLASVNNMPPSAVVLKIIKT